MLNDDPVVTMSKERSIAISKRGREARVNFNLERMQKCLEGKRFTMPDGLTPEEFHQWMKDMADEINA